MKQDFFIYDKQTLSFKKVEKKFVFSPARLLLVIGLFGAGSGFVLAFVFLFFFQTPQEAFLKRKNRQLKTRLTNFNSRLKESEQSLLHLQEKEHQLYRRMFNAPVSKPGYKGVDPQTVHRFMRRKTYDDFVDATTMRLKRLNAGIQRQQRLINELQMLYKKRKKRILHTPSIPPVDKELLQNPPHGFGSRIDPVYGIPAFHEGIDFTAETGTPVYATAKGKVTAAGYAPGGYGNKVIIDHGYSYKTLYAHLQKVLVRKNQTVKRGEKIGLIGNTGKSVAPHLHYEVHKNDKVVNPIHYYYDDLSFSEYRKLVHDANKSKTSLD